MFLTEKEMRDKFWEFYNNKGRAIKYIHTNYDLTEETRYNPDGAEERYRKNLAVKGVKPKLLRDTVAFTLKFIISRKVSGYFSKILRPPIC